MCCLVVQGRRETRHLGEREMRPVDREEHRGKLEAESRQLVFQLVLQGARSSTEAVSAGIGLLVAACSSLLWVWRPRCPLPVGSESFPCPRMDPFYSGSRGSSFIARKVLLIPIGPDHGYHHPLCARPCHRHLRLSFF